MDQFVLHFFLYFSHILLFASGVKVELMVVLGDTQLATDALTAKLPDAYDLLW
jgi:hypothetical protein